MRTIVITGGIATGKTTACALFTERVPGSVFFDSDKEVHELLTKQGIKDKLRVEFGDAVFTSDNEVDRSRLGEIVFSDSTKRQWLEGVLHPEVLERCLGAMEEARDAGNTPLFLADVPLYYEVDFPIEANEVVVVAATRETRLRRLRERSSLGVDEAARLLDIQLPIEEKMRRGDRVLWNEGSLSGLKKQVHYAAIIQVDSYGQ